MKVHKFPTTDVGRILNELMSEPYLKNKVKGSPQNAGEPFSDTFGSQWRVRICCNDITTVMLINH